MAGDIVRALKREFRLGAAASYSFYYTVIEGANAFAAHHADSIGGWKELPRWSPELAGVAR